MRIRRVAGWLLFPLLFLASCSKPPQERLALTPPSEVGKSVVTVPQAPAPTQTPPPNPSAEKPLLVRFLLRVGGSRPSDPVSEVAAGETVIVGLEPFDLDIILPELNEEAARKALKVDGAELMSPPVWLPQGRLSLRFGAGKPEQKVVVRVQASGRQPAALTLRRAMSAAVTVDQRFGDGWKPLVVLDAYTPPGPSAVRLSFSKPVRKQEVEQALLVAQSVPIRGLMEWLDDKTLVWQIAALPPRLDFMLGGARDNDGLPLPGGIPSLRVGEPPQLVTVSLPEQSEKVLGTVPPDIILASLNRERKVVNLKAWTPGRTKWEWQAADIYFDYAKKSLNRGSVEESRPRLSSDLENWVVSPSGALVAGLKSRSEATRSHQADLVITDMRGGRTQTFPQAIGRFRGDGQLDLATHLAWSPDSLQIAALSFAGDSQRSDLVLIEAATGKKTLLIAGLPIHSDGTRLAWSPSGRWLLAGNLLVDLKSRGFRTLAGAPGQVVGFWEPGNDRLLYNQNDWGPIQLVDPSSGEIKPMGDGLAVGWDDPGRILLIRWSGSGARYIPPGQ